MVLLYALPGGKKHALDSDFETLLSGEIRERASGL